MKKIALTLAAVSALSLAACQAAENEATEASNEVEATANEADLDVNASEAAENALDAAANLTDQAGEAIENAAEATGEAVENATGEYAVFSLKRKGRAPKGARPFFYVRRRR